MWYIYITDFWGLMWCNGFLGTDVVRICFHPLYPSAEVSNRYIISAQLPQSCEHWSRAKRWCVDLDVFGLCQFKTFRNVHIYIYIVHFLKHRSTKKTSTASYKDYRASFFCIRGTLVCWDCKSWFCLSSQIADSLFECGDSSLPQELNMPRRTSWGYGPQCRPPLSS